MLCIILAVRETDVDIFVVKIELGVDIAENSAICANNLFQFNFDEIIERVDMLLDQAFDLEESGQKIPLVSGGVDRICQGFAVVKWLEDCIETVVLSIIVLCRWLLPNQSIQWRPRNSDKKVKQPSAECEFLLPR